MTTVTEIRTVLEEVKAIVTNVGGDVDSLIAQVVALKEQVASGMVVSQEDLDSIGAAAADIKIALAGVDEKEPALS